MKKKGLLKLVVPISLVAVLAVALPLASGCRPAAPPAELEPVVIGYIGPVAKDSGISAMRGAEIAVDEFNEAGGILGGRPIKLVITDSAYDVAEGIKAYEYLNEVEKVDFIISASIDDVSTGWFPRMAEYRTPTIDTWTSSYLLVQKVVEDYEKYKMYFQSMTNDWFFGAQMVEIGKDVFYDQLGWDTCVVFQEDTAYAAGVAEFIVAELAPYAGIEVIDHVVYDPYTVDFAPIYAGMVATDPDFIYHICSVNVVVPTAQYVELQVPLPITGINEAAAIVEYWEDTGGMGGGISTMQPPPTIGMEYDPRTQAFIDKYQQRYPTRPKFPNCNGFFAYYGVYHAVEAAERVYQAGLGPGFEPLDAWAKEMLETDLVLYRDGEVWYVERYYAPGEIEPITGMEWTHNIKFDLEGVEGKMSMLLIQWYEDGTVRVIYPPKYATGEIAFPAWIPEEKLPEYMR